jgi:DNA-binding MarR family transcriptional regulator
MAVVQQLNAEELGAWVGLLAAHQQLVGALDAELERAHGVTLAEYDVLVQLARAPRGRLRMGELAEAVILTRSGLTRLVDRLERRGLVERVRCPADRRGLHALLTDTGHDLLREASATHLDGVRRLFLDPLEAGDVERLASIWARLGIAPAGGDCGSM